MEENLKIIGAILGGMSFFVSFLSLWRANVADKRSRTMLVAQKVEELQAMLWRNKVAYTNSNRRFMGALWEAEFAQTKAPLSGPMNDFIPKVNKITAHNKEESANIEKMLSKLSSDVDAKRTYDEKMRYLREYKGRIMSTMNAEAIEASADELVEMAQPFLTLEDRLTAIFTEVARKKRTF